ncbi:MAG: hypothetical protein HKN20_02600 [Gemmatimonadetes bacterium]|nr:hypothetical protein [Gemmatimonadota bacterium]
MWPIVQAFTKFFDLLIALFQSMHPIIGLTVISILTGAVMLVVWKYTSNQKAIAAAKAKISAYILEIRLFPDDMRAQFSAQRKALLANAKYMTYAVPPLLVVLLPVVAILVQLDVRYQRKPLEPGDVTLLKVKVAEEVDLASVTLDAPAGLVMETAAMRVVAEDEVDWRLRADTPGEYDVTVNAGGTVETKRIVVGERLTKLAEFREQSNFLTIWMAPAEKPLPKGSPIQEIRLTYPEREMKLAGISLHWLLVFFVVSVLFGFAIKGVVGVEV